MEIHGYLAYGDEDVIGISEIPNCSRWQVDLLPDIIREHFGGQHWDGYHHIGGYTILIPNVSMRIYYTDKACTLEEAESSLLDKMYGNMTVITSNTGYSEYTITGMDLNTFSIGGHDLRHELENHIGEYCWIIIETD